jgi:protein O-GlcNAc transferase
MTYEAESTRAVVPGERLDSAALLRQALAYHQAGLLNEAEGLYRRILQSEPGHFDSLHMLGVIAYQRGSHAAALEKLGHALAIDPRAAPAHNNRGVVLAALMRLEEAIASYDHAIALAPGYVDALINRGNALKDLGRLQQALASYDRALALNPARAEACNKRGNVLVELGRVAEALASYDRAIALKPDFSEACNNRGVALAKHKRFADAVASYDQALAVRPLYAEALKNRGHALIELERFADALASYEKAIEIEPTNPEAFKNQGRALAGLKRYAEALASYERAISTKPDYAEAFNNRGNALLELQRFAEALASYDRAIALEPDSALAHYNRGNALDTMKRFEEAVASYDRAIALYFDYADAWNNRGNALGALQRHEEALASFDQAIALTADYADAFNNRANALKDLKRLDEALRSCDRAIALKPDHAEYFNNRAIVLTELKRYDEALACYGRAIALKPDYADALSNRGYALRDLKRYEEALASFGQAIAVKPDMDYVRGAHLHVKMHICDWSNFAEQCEGVSAAISSGHAASLPMPLLAIPASGELQLRCAKRYSEDRYRASRTPLWCGERYRHDRIRLAYLSSDLRDHAVTFLAGGMFEHHDRGHFETYAMSFKSDGATATRARLQDVFDRFVDARAMSDLEVARRLREMEIDIAVDLNGFTDGCRPAVFARRPVPVQVNYLGYAGTLGQVSWDYIIADRFVIPEDARGDFAEQVAYLPDTFMATDRARKIAADTPSRGEVGLPERGVVFCCFNNSFKITPDLFDVWTRLLRAVEGSVLWLSAANASAPDNLRREAERRGVSAERLIFAPKTRLNEDHLARLRLADLFLDTLYYNAHATACDALWAGLPVLTCAGSTFASRVAGSLLSAVGLPELITCSLAEYEALALKLARDPALLGSIREKLARNRETYPLFDTARFTRHIEAAYIGMWERSQRGEPPLAFDVAPMSPAATAEGTCE